MGVQHEIEAVLKGHVALADSPAHIQSWARFFIYQAAVEVLGMPRSEREAALLKAPEGLRQVIKDEAIRVHQWRREGWG